MKAYFHIADWIVLFLYFSFTMGIGVYFYKKTRSTIGFTAGGRELPGWACGLSILATYLSSISYLALPGKAFASNWNAFVFSLSIPLVAIFAFKIFVPYYRESGEISAYALLEKRFGTWARIYASFFYLLTQIARIAVVMYLMALPMQVIFGWNIYTIIIVTGICVTLYSFAGGLKAVIWTDAIQAIVLMAGAVITVIVIVLNSKTGFSGIISTASHANKFSLGSMTFDFTKTTFWVVLLYGISINLQNFGIDQSYIQRYIASKTDKEAGKSLLIGALLYVPLSALFLFIGTSLYSIYSKSKADILEVKMIVAKQKLLEQGIPEKSPLFLERCQESARDLKLSDIGDRVFPHFIAKYLPPGLTGLLIAAIFAAAMSTISTSINSSSTLILFDYYKRFLRRRAKERESMVVLYLGTILWGGLGTGLSLLLVKMTQSALDIWWILSGIFGGGMCGLFLLGILSKKAKNMEGIAGVILGVIIIFWLSIPKIIDYMMRFPRESKIHSFALNIRESYSFILSPLHAFMVPVLGTLTIVVVGGIIAKLRRS